MALTGQQIAQMVGCSVSTVSRALNNAAGVNQDSRRAILKLVEKHGQPVLRRPRNVSRAAARPAKAGGLIEVILLRLAPFESVRRDGAGAIVTTEVDGPERFASPQNRVGNSYYQAVIDGAIAEAQAFGHRVVVQITGSLPGALVRPEPGESQPKGMLILGERCEGLEAFVRSASCPVVTTIGDAGLQGADTVGIENMDGIAAGFAHLRGLGHERIGYVAGHGAWPLRERYDAFRLRMLDAGLPIRPEWIVKGTTHMGQIREAMLAMLARPDRPTAMMACYDGAALAVVQAAQQLGLRVPKDLSVVGFDDEAIAGMCNPPLTTLAVPAFEIGQSAVRMMMVRSQGQTVMPSGVGGMRVRTRLVVRESTGPVAGA